MQTTTLLDPMPILQRINDAHFKVSELYVAVDDMLAAGATVTQNKLGNRAVMLCEQAENMLLSVRQELYNLRIARGG